MRAFIMGPTLRSLLASWRYDLFERQLCTIGLQIFPVDCRTLNVQWACAMEKIVHTTISPFTTILLIVYDALT